MNKNQEMEALLDKIALQSFGRRYSQTEECVFCGSRKVAPEDFRDMLSRREYVISHICQACQDEVFEEPEDEGPWNDTADEEPRQ